MKKPVQGTMLCRCGEFKILAQGMCATCYTLRRQDEAYFGGCGSVCWSEMATVVAYAKHPDVIGGRSSCTTGGRAGHSCL